MCYRYVAGVSMSFTAFPVLASLLTTLGLLHTPIGTRVSTTLVLPTNGLQHL
jgi:Kef-type K+ transport system membrane component KefB